MAKCCASYGGAKGVTPKRFLGDRAAKAREHKRQAAGESQILDSPEAESEDSFANRGDLAALAKQGGIGEAKALCGRDLS